MSIDAYVNCDCFERGRLRSSPPPGCHLSIDDDGSLMCGSDNLEIQMAFDAWQSTEACVHEDGRLVSHHIGNIALVGWLRSELGKWPERFPVLLSKVIPNGTHCGDFIPTDEVPRLIPELAALATVHHAKQPLEQHLRNFERQLRELVSASLSSSKPILF